MIEAAAKEVAATRVAQLRMLGGSFARSFTGSWRRSTVAASFPAANAPCSSKEAGTGLQAPDDPPSCVPVDTMHGSKNCNEDDRDSVFWAGDESCAHACVSSQPEGRRSPPCWQKKQET